MELRIKAEGIGDSIQAQEEGAEPGEYKGREWKWQGGSRWGHGVYYSWVDGGALHYDKLGEIALNRQEHIRKLHFLPKKRACMSSGPQEGFHSKNEPFLEQVGPPSSAISGQTNSCSLLAEA